MRFQPEKLVQWKPLGSDVEGFRLHQVGYTTSSEPGIRTNEQEVRVPPDVSILRVDCLELLRGGAVDVYDPERSSLCTGDE